MSVSDLERFPWPPEVPFESRYSLSERILVLEPPANMSFIGRELVARKLTADEVDIRLDATFQGHLTVADSVVVTAPLTATTVSATYASLSTASVQTFAAQHATIANLWSPFASLSGLFLGSTITADSLSVNLAEFTVAIADHGTLTRLAGTTASLTSLLSDTIIASTITADSLSVNLGEFTAMNAVHASVTSGLFLSGLANAADDATAAGLGVPLGGIYHNAGALRVRLV